MRIGHKFNPEICQEKIDTIIIGSGVGGLTCASLLSKMGEKVVVLEQHYTAGGLSHTFSRKSFEWDVGLHYVGEVHRQGHPIKNLFDYISGSKLKWSFVGSRTERIKFPDKEFLHLAGEKSVFIDHLKKDFPHEEIAINRYLELNEKIHRSAKFHIIARSLPKFFDFLTKLFVGRTYRKYSLLTTHDVLCSLTKNKRLISVLTGNYGDYALPPKHSSYVVHALVSNHYLHGASYPIGGGRSIAKFIEEELNRYGGNIFINCSVKEIIVKENIAVGVLLENGKSIYADKIISNAGAHVTFNRLVRSENIPRAFLNKLNKIKGSTGTFVIYLGLNESDSALKLPKENIWIHPDDEYSKNFDSFHKEINEKIPFLFVSFPSSRDPSNKGKSTISLLTLVNPDFFKDREGSTWKKRGEKYLKLKEDVEKRCLAIFYENFPELEKHVEYIESSTPLTNKHFSKNMMGEPYGLSHCCDRFNSDVLRPKGPIKNLYTTGVDNVTVGIAPAAISGVQTVLAIHPLKSLKKLKAAGIL